MKEEINLLPADAQKERQHKLYSSRLRSLYAAIIGGLIIVGLGYAGSYAVLWWTLNDIQHSLTSEQQNTNDIDAKTQTANRELGAVHDTLQQHIPWMPYVADALNAVPAGITITNVDINAVSEGSTEKALVISGRSDTRIALVAFQKALQELSWSDSVDSPLQNLASGPNVTFTFTITRKL